MSKNDEPITRFTSLEFAPDPNSTFNGLYPPQLTTQEIENVPTTSDRIGCIIFNDQNQELQTLSAAQQWVNITTDQGEPTFTELTVTGPSNLNSLSVTNNITSSGVIIGARPGASFYSTFSASFGTTAVTPMKIPNGTTLIYGNGFTNGGTNNRIQYVPTTGYPTTIRVLVTASINLTTVTTTTNYYGYIYKNGSPIGTTDTVAQETIATTTAGQLTIATSLTMVNNDYLELWISSTLDSSSNIVPCNMTVTQI